jgi:hypothetical protein
MVQIPCIRKCYMIYLLDIFMFEIHNYYLQQKCNVR